MVEIFRKNIRFDVRVGGGIMNVDLNPVSDKQAVISFPGNHKLVGLEYSIREIDQIGTREFSANLGDFKMTVVGEDGNAGGWIPSRNFVLFVSPRLVQNNTFAPILLCAIYFDVRLLFEKA